MNGDEELIEAWAEDCFRHTGRWPHRESGAVSAAPGKQWVGVSNLLRLGVRSLPAGFSLPHFLVRYIAKRERALAAPYDTGQIAYWIQAFAGRFGKYPTGADGSAACPPWETWDAIDTALREGRRGLPGGSSLTMFRNQLIDEGVLVPLKIRGREFVSPVAGRGKAKRPPLDEDLILSWADEHFERYSSWPSEHTGRVEGHEGERWSSIDDALRRGHRGLLPGSSLAILLEEKRGKEHHLHQKPLTVEEILQWADEHFAALGVWPNRDSGQVLGHEQETWCAVNIALRKGMRGLPTQSSLSNLLEERRSVQNRLNKPRFTVEKILQWVDEFYAAHGVYPTLKSGPIDDSPGDTWYVLDKALRNGNRGLTKGSSLYRLINRHRSAGPRCTAPIHNIDQIALWMQSYAARSGRYPDVNSGTVEEKPDVTWNALGIALRVGYRGLPGGSSLAKLKQQLIADGKLPDLSKP